MVKPIHLQDNFGKTLVAQKFADDSHTGAEKLHQVHQQAVSQELERRTKQQTVLLEERKGLKSLDRDGSNRQPRLKKEPRQEDGVGENVVEEAENDLPLRRDEDERGKGAKLDVKG